MRFEYQKESLTIFVDRDLYGESPIFQCLYWFTGKYVVDVTADLKCYKVNLRNLDGRDFENAETESLAAKFSKDLIDFKLRDIVSKETSTIRELIIAKAFAYYESDDLSATDISDPVGFDPLKVGFYE